MNTRLSIDTVADHVTQIAMSGGGLNPLGLDLARELGEAFDELMQDADCRAVVLSSSDRHFCAGATAKFEAGGIPWSTSDLYAEVPRLLGFAKPVVVALNGAAVGGGVGLALVGDWRQMSSDARLQVNFSRLGYTPGFGLTRTLPDLIGTHRATELMVSGRPVNAEEALSMGLCDAISDPEQLITDAVERAQVFAEGAPQPAQAVKLAARRSLLADLDAVLAAELAEQSALKETEDYAEGIAAMKERRAPRFRGR